MKYCQHCGKILVTEIDFSKSTFTDKVTFIKRCKHCKETIDKVTVKTNG